MLVNPLGAIDFCLIKTSNIVFISINIIGVIIGAKAIKVDGNSLLSSSCSNHILALDILF